MEVRLYRKPIIRRLHPKRFSDTLNFPCHLALILEREQVFDDRIAKNHVQAAIAELSEIPGVAGEWGYVRMPLLFCDEVQSENLDICAPVPAPISQNTLVPPTSRSRRGRGKRAARASNWRKRFARSLFANEVGSLLFASRRNIRGKDPECASLSGLASKARRAILTGPEYLNDLVRIPSFHAHLCCSPWAEMTVDVVPTEFQSRNGRWRTKLALRLGSPHDLCP